MAGALKRRRCPLPARSRRPPLLAHMSDAMHDLDEAHDWSISILINWSVSILMTGHQHSDPRHQLMLHTLCQPPSSKRTPAHRRRSPTCTMRCTQPENAGPLSQVVSWTSAGLPGSAPLLLQPRRPLLLAHVQVHDTIGTMLGAGCRCRSKVMSAQCHFTQSA